MFKVLLKYRDMRNKKGEFMKNTTSLLFDDYRVEGNDLNELKRTLKEFDDVTRPEIVRKKDMNLYFVPDVRHTEKRVAKNGKYVLEETKDLPENEIDKIHDAGSIFVYALPAGNPWQYSESGVPRLSTNRLKTEFLKTITDKDRFLNELKKNKVFFTNGRSLYFVGENFISTFGLRVDMSGESLLDNTLERNVHIAQRLNNNDEMTLIIRNVEGVDKIYAALSAKYAYIKQSVLMDIIERFDPAKKLGKIVCNRWEITQTRTRIELEFPEKAKELQATYKLKDTLVPGLILEKSDVGECSVTIKGTWRLGNHPMVEREIKKKHIGNIDIEQIVKQAKEEIFDKYTILPERLCELMLIDVSDPKARVYGSRKFAEINRDIIGKTLKYVFGQIDLVKAISKKNEKKLYEAMCLEFDPSITYTAYDICMAIMNVVDRMPKVNDVYREKFEKAVGKAPYAEYKLKSSSSIILMP